MRRHHASRSTYRAPAPALAALPLAVLVAAACAGPRDAPVEAEQSVLAHDPGAGTAVYDVDETTTLVVGAGTMGAVDVIRSQRGRAEVRFEPGDEASDAVVRLTAFEATAENPRQGAARATAADVRGAWRVRLGPRGVVAVVERPRLSPAARAAAEPDRLARQLFVSLPGTPATVGTQWVDTVTVAEEGGDLDRRTTAITTYIVAGDTLALGRQLLLIRTESATRVEVDGATGGVLTRQLLAGTLSGHVLWDPDEALLVAREEAGELSGSLALPESGAGALLVTAVQTRSVRLVD